MKSQKSLASSSSNSLTPEASRIRTSEEVSRENTRPVLQNESTFSTKQSRSRSLKKAANHLPQSPRKKVEIIRSLASKHQIRIKMHENPSRPRKELSEEKKDWMIEFLVKGVYGLKFFNLAEGEQPLYTQWYSNAKDVVICGHNVADVDENHCVLCPEEYQQRREEWLQCLGLCQQWYHEQCFCN